MAPRCPYLLFLYRVTRAQWSAQIKARTAKGKAKNSTLFPHRKHKTNLISLRTELGKIPKEKT